MKRYPPRSTQRQSLVRSDSKESLTLALIENWKYGKREINYLVLSWRINRHISIPLMFMELDKAGNSNTAERLDLLEKFNTIFGFERINQADREFIGTKWFKELHMREKIPCFPGER